MEKLHGSLLVSLETYKSVSKTTAAPGTTTTGKDKALVLLFEPDKTQDGWWDCHPTHLWILVLGTSQDASATPTSTVTATTGEAERPQWCVQREGGAEGSCSWLLWSPVLTLLFIGHWLLLPLVSEQPCGLECRQVDVSSAAFTMINVSYK